MTHSWTWEEENPGLAQSAELRAQRARQQCLYKDVCIKHGAHTPAPCCFYLEKMVPKKILRRKKYDVYMIHRRKNLQMWTTLSVIDLSTYNSAVQSAHSSNHPTNVYIKTQISNKEWLFTHANIYFTNLTVFTFRELPVTLQSVGHILFSHLQIVHESFVHSMKRHRDKGTWALRVLRPFTRTASHRSITVTV